MQAVALDTTVVQPGHTILMTGEVAGRFLKLYQELQSHKLHQPHDSLTTEQFVNSFLRDESSSFNLEPMADQAIVSRPDIDSLAEIFKERLLCGDDSVAQRSSLFLAKYYCHTEIQPPDLKVSKTILRNGLASGIRILEQFAKHLMNDEQTADRVLAEIKSLALDRSLSHRQRSTAASVYMKVANYQSDQLCDFLHDALRSNSGPVVSGPATIILRDSNFEFVQKTFTPDELFKIFYCLLAYPSILSAPTVPQNMFKIFLELAKQDDFVSRLDQQFQNPQFVVEDDFINRPMPIKNLPAAILNVFGFRTLIALAIYKFTRGFEGLGDQLRKSFHSILEIFMQAKDLAKQEFELPAHQDIIEQFLDVINPLE